MSLVTDFLSAKYDVVDFLVIYGLVSVLSEIASYYLDPFVIGELWAILGVLMAVFLLKNGRSTSAKDN